MSICWILFQQLYTIWTLICLLLSIILCYGWDLLLYLWLYETYFFKFLSEYSIHTTYSILTCLFFHLLGFLSLFHCVGPPERLAIFVTYLPSATNISCELLDFGVYVHSFCQWLQPWFTASYAYLLPTLGDLLISQFFSQNCLYCFQIQSYIYWFHFKHTFYDLLENRLTLLYSTCLPRPEVSMGVDDW